MSDLIKDRGVEKKSGSLENRRVAVGACGGIGSVELVKLFRELRRHGAEVFPFVTPSVRLFITELSLRWAAGNDVVSEADSDVDHFGTFDSVLIAPATLNTISKCATGIADNAVTLLVASQWHQGARIQFVPTMNARLRNHPMYEQHRGRLTEWGATFFENEMEEDRLKMPSPEKLANFVIEGLRK